eukprot:TRINITY_DN2720_c0_g1_i4.p3 TRINITY_DN2720_c0_g1~~TRINITY_DN2720_c0_g1_i4.p3  ORF type:complete len:420 (-),score=39.47 TRINITY_DN2720_c0_g1_i4:5540-6799(-)
MGFWSFLSRRRYSFDENRPVVDLAKIRDSKEFNSSAIDTQDQEDSSEESFAPPPPRRRRTGLDISRAYSDPQAEWQDRAVGLGSTVFVNQLTSMSQLEGVCLMKETRFSKFVRGYLGTGNRSVLVKVYKNDIMSSFEAECMYREIKLLCSLKRCEGIVDIQQTLQEIDGTRLVFDGQVQFLEELLQSRQIPLSLRDVSLGIVKPVLIGLGYLHSAGIIVRNLSCDTILLSPSGAMIGNLFYHADKHVSLPIDRVTKLLLSAPEVLSKPEAHDIFQVVMQSGVGENDLPSYDEAADIWSLGVIVYKLLVGEKPFKGNTPEQVAEDQRRKLKGERKLPLPQFLHELDIPILAKSFISECLQLEPENRKTAEQLLEHPWLTTMLTNCAGSGKDFPNFRNLVTTSLGSAGLTPRALLCPVQEY